MIHGKTIVTLTGGLVLVLATTSCSSRPATRTTANSPSRDNVVASDRMARTTTPADRTVATERPIPSNRTGAGDSPYDSDRATACANQKDDMTGSPDCVPQNRPTAAASDRTEYGSKAVSGCAYRRDAAGNVIYDDPSCPTRYRQAQRPMGSSYENVNLTKNSAFFDRYIEKAVKHAREGEIAGDQGNVPEMFQHANLALAQAKQAQRAGNVTGLEEGILELREAMHLALLPDHTPSNRMTSDRTASCVDQQGNAITSGDCGPQDRRMDGNVIATDTSAYDAPTRCTFQTDTNGNVIYDDPTCPTRYRQSRTSTEDATAHMREARIRLSEAAGMRSVDTRAPRAMGNVNSRVEAR